MIRPATIALLSAFLLTPAAAQEAVGEGDAATYFAPPEMEEAPSVLDEERLEGAGAVALAISLGQVETALEGCRETRREMTALIGDDYGSRRVNPGWLRRYQACVLQRSDEARRLGEAIGARKRELLEQVSTREADGEDLSDEAQAAADLMARLGARQSAVKLAVREEVGLQKAFVDYYNTGELPDALVREAAAPQTPATRVVPTPARSMPVRAPARLFPNDLPDEATSETAPGPLDGAVIMPEDSAEPLGDEGPMADDAVPPGATGAPMPLRAQ